MQTRASGLLGHVANLAARQSGEAFLPPTLAFQTKSSCSKRESEHPPAIGRSFVLQLEDRRSTAQMEGQCPPRFDWSLWHESFLLSAPESIKKKKIVLTMKFPK